MKKVLIITYYWPPSGGAGVQRWLKFVKYLRDYGWEPVVLTVDPFVASYTILDKSLVIETEGVNVYRTKTFEPLIFYKKVFKKKQLPYGGFANEKKVTFFDKILRFVRGNFFLPDVRRGWNKYALKKAREIIKDQKINIVVTTSPPHSTQLIGLKLKEEFKISWIADLRDPWTDIYYYNKLYPTRLAKWIDGNFEKKVLNKADYLIVVSDAIKNIFRKKQHKKNKSNIIVIPNGYDEQDFIGHKKEKSEVFTITYVGTISESHYVDTFLKVFKELVDRNNKMRLRFVGGYSDSFIRKIIDFGLKDNTEIISYVEHKEAISNMINSNMLLLIIPQVKNNKGILTGKLFEYLASRTPIICLGPEDGDAAAILKNTGCGKTFDFEEVEKLKEHILKSFSLFKKNKLTPSCKNIEQYKRKNLTKELCSIFQEISV